MDMSWEAQIWRWLSTAPSNIVSEVARYTYYIKEKVERMVNSLAELLHKYIVRPKF